MFIDKLLSKETRQLKCNLVILVLRNYILVHADSLVDVTLVSVVLSEQILSLADVVGAVQAFFQHLLSDEEVAELLIRYTAVQEDFGVAWFFSIGLLL